MSKYIHRNRHQDVGPSLPAAARQKSCIRQGYTQPFNCTVYFDDRFFLSVHNSTKCSGLNHLCSSHGSKVAIFGHQGTNIYILLQICYQHVIISNFHVWIISVALMDQKLQFLATVGPFFISITPNIA